jgi:hypothetical protein
MATRAGKRTRLTIDVSPELRQRIKMAAAQRDVSVSQYVVDILEGAVSPEESKLTHGTGIITKETLEQLDRLRERVMRGRPPFTDDSTDIINETRLERTAELERAAGYEPMLSAQEPFVVGTGIVTAEMIEELNRVRKAIMRGRPPFSDDSTDLVNEARMERTEEL